MALSGTFFDATYYLAQNSDVANYWSGSPLAHYEAYGAAEGRNPNAWFDAQYYRTTYTDLQDMNALELFQHYETWGYKEGRVVDSEYANFDEAQYLADYDDLGANGITEATALSHYLQYGISESRVAKDDDGTTIAAPNTTGGENKAFTTGIDSLEGSGGNDTFVGGVAGAGTDTVNLGDAIDGKAGTDTFRVSVAGGNAIPGIQTTAVENYEIISAGNDTLAINGNTTGLEKVTFSGGANSSFGLSNVDTGITVALHNDDNQVTIGYTGTTGETAVNLEVNGAKTNSSFNVGAGVETVNLATTGKDSTLAALSDGANTDLTKVVVTGDKALTVTTALEATVKTFDASDATGNINVKTADTTAALSFKFGKGDDKFQIDQSGYTAADVVEMGDGTDTLVLDFANAATGAFNTDVSSKTTGVEVIEVTSNNTTGRTHTVAVDSTKLGVKQLVVNGDAGDNFNFTGLADSSTVTYKSNHAGSTLALADNGSANTVNIVLDGSTATGALASTGMETVNLTSQKDAAGNTNVLTSFADASTTKMVLDGAGNLTGGTITLKASAAFDANAYTGDLTATTFGAALKTYTGGSGKDEITTAAGNVAQGSTFAGGDGTDKLTTSATRDQNAGLLAITGFETLDLTLESGNADTFTADFRNVTDLASLKITGNVDGDAVVLNRLDSSVAINFAEDFASATLSLQSGDSHTIKFSGTTPTFSGALTLDAAATTLNLEADDATTLNSIVGTSLATVNVKGDSAINLGTLATTVTKVDGSTLTGALTADLTSTTDGNTLLGGTAGDSLTDSAKADTINGNAGADDIILSGGGNDTVLLDSQAESRSSSFAGADVNSDNLDDIQNFDGNGAAAGDQIQLSTVADAYGSNLTLSSSTTVNVTALSVNDTGNTNWTTTLADINTAYANTKSTSSTLQVIDVTLTTGGALQGSDPRIMIIDNGDGTIDTNDTIVIIGSAAEALHANDFVIA